MPSMMNTRDTKEVFVNKPRTYKKTEYEKREHEKLFDEIRNIDDEKCFFLRGYDDIP